MLLVEYCSLAVPVMWVSYRIPNWSNAGTVWMSSISCDKARDAFGFSPTHSVEDMITRLMEKSSEYGNYSDDRYYTIRTFDKIQHDSPLWA